jgi:hypothetical protein
LLAFLIALIVTIIDAVALLKTKSIFGFIVNDLVGADAPLRRLHALERLEKLLSPNTACCSKSPRAHHAALHWHLAGQ